ncbi:MAG TPA: mechanosensitive ion channel family protein [Thermoanaerobaculia bacterium]
MQIDEGRWLELGFLGSSVRDWLTAVALGVAAYLFLYLLKKLVIRRAGKIAERTATDVDDFVIELVRRTRRLLMLVPIAYLASFVLDLSDQARDFLKSAAVVALLLQIALWMLVAINFWVARTRRKRLEVDAASATLIGAAGFMAKLVLWTVIVLATLENVGVDVTALVAGLGIGGVAVALAVQNILGDLLASLSIVLDKPFVIGDTIHVDDYVGTVESIGLKTTHVRSISGEQIVFSNSDLVRSRLRNYKRMAERRAVFTFGVVYETPVGKLEKVPGMVREIVEAQDQVRFDRAHFKRLAESSLEFEVVYFVLSPEYSLYMDRQQAILLTLMRRLEGEGIHLSAPTRALLVEKATPLADSS